MEEKKSIICFLCINYDIYELSEAIVHVMSFSNFIITSYSIKIIQQYRRIGKKKKKKKGGFRAPLS